MIRAALVVIALGTLACNESGATGAAPSAKPSAKAVVSAAALSPSDEAKQLAQARCAMCHGLDGKGDGPSAATLNPKPRDLSNKDWQKSMSDGQLRTVILQGGVGIGKSPLMPANPDLADRPAVVDELVRIVRRYGS